MQEANPVVNDDLMEAPLYSLWCKVRGVFIRYPLDPDGPRCEGEQHQQCHMVEHLHLPLPRGTRIEVGGYNLTEAFMRDHSRLDIALALKGAGVSPEFWNESQDNREDRYGTSPNSEWMFTPDPARPGGLRVDGPTPCYLCRGYVPRMERYQVPVPFAPEGEPKVRIGHVNCLR